MTRPLEGLLLIDKPAGPTSHDVVTRAKELLPAARAGHTGTLDPGATGLLILLFGRATRLARFFPSEPKTYRGAIRFGVRTTTDDLAGPVVSTFDGTAPDPDAVRSAAAAHLGRRAQTPPSVSARKVGGKRLYRLARQGRPAVAAPAEVVITRLEIDSTDDPWTWSFEAEVSAGTYIRAIARDLGETLGCGGALAELRRTRIGPFDVQDALALDGPDVTARLREALVPLDALPLHLPPARLSEPEAKLFQNGGAIHGGPDSGSETRAVFDPAGTFLGVGVCRDQTLRPLVVLPPAFEGTSPHD